MGGFLWRLGWAIIPCRRINGWTIWPDVRTFEFERLRFEFFPFFGLRFDSFEKIDGDISAEVSTDRNALQYPELTETSTESLSIPTVLEHGRTASSDCEFPTSG